MTLWGGIWRTMETKSKIKKKKDQLFESESKAQIQGSTPPKQGRIYNGA